MPESIAPHELPLLFADFAAHRHVLLAVSGGADSTAMMLLAARWQAQHTTTTLTVATIDHALRPESAGECRQVAGLALTLGLSCLIRRWTGEKPAARLQESARAARYALLAGAAAEIGADAIATAHTLDDQAETVLMRLLHGSAVDGLAAMRRRSRRGALVQLRPLLDVPKARLTATLEEAGLEWIEDPSNRNTRFERVRLRSLLAELEPLGLDPTRLALLARRAARSSDAIEHVTEDHFTRAYRREGEEIRLDGAVFASAPAEIRLRLLERSIDLIRPGEGAAAYGLRLERLETLAQALDLALLAGKAWRRSLGGALVALDREGNIRIAPEPARRRGQTKNKM